MKRDIRFKKNLVFLFLDFRIINNSIPFIIQNINSKMINNVPQIQFELYCSFIKVIIVIINNKIVCRII